MSKPLTHAVSFCWVLAFLLLNIGSAQAALPAVTADGEKLPSLAPMLEKTSPAVVNIAIENRVRKAQNPLLDDPFFRRFFNVPPQQRSRRARSAGSGVIVDAKQGYVLTNAHVVKSADTIEVTLTDGRELSAELVGMDKEVDLAVLKLADADDLSQVHIADSTDLRVGDFVVAIGNPFGLGQTVTSGIVSALGRTGLGIEGYENFIQTDASINPGNSGGALVNLKGQLVGINTAILAPSGGNVGIGFAIPTEMAKNVMHQLIEHGEVRRGVLGVTIQNLTEELAEAFGVDRQKGVVVTQVLKDSAAEKANLKTGDVVIAVEGRPVNKVSDLRNKVGLTPVGETVRLTILRDGKKRKVKAVITESGEQQASSGKALSRYLEGANLRDLRDSDDAQVDQGVQVQDVERGSPAWRAGLRPGDVIINANREDVASLAELQNAITDKDATLLLRINRNGGVFFVVVR